MATFDFNIVDNLVFTSTATGAADPHAIVDVLVFNESLCLTLVKITAFTDVLAFQEYVTYSFPDPNDPRNLPSGGVIDDPAHGEIFPPITFKRSIIDFLQFREQVAVSGGMIWDYTCNPPRLVTNDVFLIWEYVDGADWESLTDAGWELMET